MRVLVAMSGGVDSSVAAALLVEQLGHDQVVGATLKLWGGTSDSGCCSVADVDDARRVAEQLGVVHHVFNFAAEFEERVVDPYVRGHAEGRTPNPCIECNRHLKFDRLLERARALGFDAVATGHHARRVTTPDGRFRLCRGADPLKDQSYVLAMLGQAQLADAMFPVGEMTKAQVREEAQPARSAHRGQARQPGRLLHPIRRGSGGVPRIPTAVASGPIGRPRHRRGPRDGGRRGVGHRRSATGDGPRHRREAPFRDRGGRSRPAGRAGNVRGRPGRRRRTPHRHLGRS